MTTHPLNPVRSEKGVALIIVLLLLAVMAGLTTGLTLNGQTEIAMAHNETYYARARAAAEAGMNRAVEQIIGDTTTDLIATKEIPNIGNGPIAFNDEYSYSFELLDDDDPALYGGVALTGPQLAAMGADKDPPAPENNDPDLDTNSRMILRATATGPRGTTVTIARILMRDTIAAIPGMNINPAILVNGDIELDGNSLVVNGKKGNVHSNGDITVGGDTGPMGTGITGDVTATGDIDDTIDPGGLKAGGMPVMPVPEIKAEDYLGIATHKLTSTGEMLVRTAPGVPGEWAACTGSGPLQCPTQWTFNSTTSTWRAEGAMPTSGVTKSTYYVEANVEVHGTGKSSFTEISILAEGSLKITGNGKFKPGNDSKIQFVTNGDFELGGTADADDPIDMDGQIMVREQLKMYGNSEFQGRIMVEDRDGDSNGCSPTPFSGCRRGSGTLSSNNLAGNMTVTYNGQLGGMDVPDTPLKFTNIISGWIEQ
jgi:hypothetical protein